MINSYAALEKDAELVPFTYEPEALKTNEVEIAVEYCGICHSDIAMITNEWGVSKYPIVPGHEVIGRIKAKGNEVKTFEIGQLVGLGWHSNYCHTCSNCQSGDLNLCASSEATIVNRFGGFADFVRADASAVMAIPEGMEPANTSPLFCGGITVFNPLTQFNVKPTDKVAVIGIGGLGHLALQFYNAWGCEVTAITSHDDKRHDAMSLGAHHTISSRNSDEMTQADGYFDYIISTVGAPLDWNLYLSMLHAKGRLHFVGVTTAPLGLNLMPMIAREISVSASPVGSPGTIAKMLNFAKLHDVSAQIEVFPFDKINEAVNHTKSGKARYRVVLKHG